LIIELPYHGLNCKQQSSVRVFYKRIEVGLYFTDIIVDDQIIIELKSGREGIVIPHELQLLNYLKATGFEVGLIFISEKNPHLKEEY